MPRPTTASHCPRPGVVVLLVLSCLALPGCRTLLDPFLEPVVAPPSAVEGRVFAETTAAGPVVVYLEALDESTRARAPEAPPDPVATSVETGVFSARVAAVAVGQELEFVTHGDILHKLFSYDARNAFELGAGAPGEPARVRFAHPGPLHYYCSLHPAEGGRIFVTPGPLFAIADARGAFRIEAVPAGLYELKTWSTSTQPGERVLVVPMTEAETLEIGLAAQADE